MKKIVFTLSIALGAMIFYSCGKEEALTPNPSFDENATGNNPTTGTGSGSGTGGGSSRTFLASSTPGNRTALLEEFTGVRCQYCPDGAVVAKAIHSALGDKFITIGIHGPSFASPGGTSDPSAPAGIMFADFRSGFEQILWTKSKGTGFPAGVVNRIPGENFTSIDTTARLTNATAISRSYWRTAVNEVIAMSAPVNLGGEAAFVGDSLIVFVDLYYTSEETTENRLNVALLQNDIIGSQIDSKVPHYIVNYEFDHVLRTLITGQWGVEITESKAVDSKITRRFAYFVPTDYNGPGPNSEGMVVKEDLEIVAFVTRGENEVLNALKVDIN